jgi:type VI secretion system secreted protein Hcp
MAMSAFLILKGQKQGSIKGSVTQKGREGQIEIHSWTWNLDVPTSGGLPTGQAVAGEFHLTKERDRSSPLLFTALAENENLTQWQLNIWDAMIGPSGAGAEEITQVWKLTNARITSMRQSGLAPPPSGSWGDPEELTFVFEKIELEHQDGGILFSYDPHSNP